MEGGLEEGATNIMTSLTLTKTDLSYVLVYPARRLLIVLVSSVTASRVLTTHICSCTENNTGGMKSGRAGLLM